MRILALVLAGCGAAPAPPPVIAQSSPPTDAAVDAAPDAQVPAIEAVSVVGPSSTPGRTPRIPTSPMSPADLDKAMIRTMVKRHIAAIAACYEKWSPDALPRVVVKFTIGADGRVLSSQASGAQAGLENCIAALYKGFVFDPPAGGGTLTVTYPLNFDTAGI
jgi:hypothetical protein